MPLTWDRAFGGSDLPREGRGEPVVEARNPVGRGIVHAQTATPIAGLSLPNLEDPSHLIRSPADRPVPVGCGPIPPAWQPRLAYAGTYDEAWQRGRAPYLPRDFDPRFFQAAPPDQIVHPHLAGGEIIHLVGLSPDGPLQVQVPTCSPQIGIVGGPAGMIPPRPVLDTIVIEPALDRCCVTWRSLMAVDTELLTISVVDIGDPHQGCRHG